MWSHLGGGGGRYEPGEGAALERQGVGFSEEDVTGAGWADALIDLVFDARGLFFRKLVAVWLHVARLHLQEFLARRVPHGSSMCVPLLCRWERVDFR